MAAVGFVLVVAVAILVALFYRPQTHVLERTRAERSDLTDVAVQTVIMTVNRRRCTGKQ